MQVKFQLILFLIGIVFTGTAQPSDVSKGNPNLVTLSLQDVETKYGKKYKNQEEKVYRKLVLQKNKKKINDHNDNRKKGLQTFELGENQFIDLSPEQFSRRYAGLVPSTPGVRQFVEDAGKYKNLAQKSCDCNAEQAAKKAELQKKIAKNQYQYNRIFTSHYKKKNQIDNLINSQVSGNPNATSNSNSNANSNSKGNLKKNPTNIAQSVSLSLSNKPKLASILTPIEVLTLDDLTNTTNTQAAVVVPLIFKSNLPNVDWASRSGPVRHQGLCGACYAFASANAVQAAYFIMKTDSFNQFSVQQIIDCPVPNINGCNGGLLEWGFFQFQYSGVTFQKVYPYSSGVSANPGDCSIESGQNRINFYFQLDGTCSHLREQVQRKPVATSMKSQNLQFYAGGIYNNCTTIVDERELDHAVLIVGFNNNIGWKMKNTWGSTWGVNGYGWITLDQNKNCGICMQPVSMRLWQEKI